MKRSLFCKISAVILSAVLLISTAVFTAVTVFVAVAGGYTSGYGVLHEEVMYSLLYSYADEVSEAYERGENISELYENSNFSYVITDRGETVLSSYDDSETYVRTAYVTKKYRGYPEDSVIYIPPEAGDIDEI